MKQHKKALKKITNVLKIVTVLKPAIELVKWNIWLWNTHPHIGVWIIGVEISLLITFICWYIEEVYLSSSKK